MYVQLRQSVVPNCCHVSKDLPRASKATSSSVAIVSSVRASARCYPAEASCHATDEAAMALPFFGGSSVSLGYECRRAERRCGNRRSSRRATGAVASMIPMDSARIKVIGVGGGGNNAVNRMIGSGLQTSYLNYVLGASDDKRVAASKNQTSSIDEDGFLERLTKDVQNIERSMPDFDELDRDELQEFLDLELESSFDFETYKHYEIMFLIHEHNVDEVQAVIKKVQDFISENKGVVYRLNDWGMRNLAYKIKKASRANYVLMNIEIKAQAINELNTLFEKDERVIRHMVMSQKDAISTECLPPEEYNPSRSGEEQEEEDTEEEDEEEDEEEEDEMNETELVFKRE